MELVFICNKEDVSLLRDYNVLTITNLKDFHKLKWEKIHGVILKAELNWKGNLLSHFKGIELIKTIRVSKKSGIPIILTSYAPYELIKTCNDKAGGFGFVGFYQDKSVQYKSFCEILLSGINSIIEFLPRSLDKDLLTDVGQTLYDLDGYPAEFFHDLRNKLSKKDLSPLEALQLVIKECNKLRDIYWHNENISQVITKYTQQLTLKSGALKKGELLKAINSFRKEVLEQLNNKRKRVEGEKIHILIIDDNIDFALDIKLKLERFNIDTLIAKNWSETEKLLKKKNGNNVRVIICDYRFYDKDNQYQYEQGYHIINKIRMIPVSRFIIAFSDYPNYIAKHKNVFFLQKSDIDDLGIGALGQLIITEHEKKLKELHPFEGRPDWMISYNLHKESKDFKNEEMNISLKALKFIKAITEGKNEDLHKIEELKGKLRNKNNSKNLENFRKRLLARRIALGILQLPRRILRISITANVNDETWKAICNLLERCNLDDLGKYAVSKTDEKDFISKILFMKKRKTNKLRNGDETLLTKEEKIWLDENRYKIIDGII